MKKMIACLVMVSCLFIAGCPAVDFVAERLGYVPESETGWVDVLEQIDDIIND